MLPPRHTHTHTHTHHLTTSTNMHCKVLLTFNLRSCLFASQLLTRVCTVMMCVQRCRQALRASQPRTWHWRVTAARRHTSCRYLCATYAAGEAHTGHRRTAGTHLPSGPASSQGLERNGCQAKVCVSHMLQIPTHTFLHHNGCSLSAQLAGQSEPMPRQLKLEVVR